MVPRVWPGVVLTALALTGCSSGGEDIFHDLSTPEGAILCLEDAYRAGDVEAAVRCKDFTIEATLMLQRLQVEGDRRAGLVSQRGVIADQSRCPAIQTVWTSIARIGC